jgi:hypothetical protein
MTRAKFTELCKTKRHLRLLLSQLQWNILFTLFVKILSDILVEVQFRLEHAPPPESVCSLPCELGQAKKYVEGESCCWHCFNCTQYQVGNVVDVGREGKKTINERGNRVPGRRWSLFRSFFLSLILSSLLSFLPPSFLAAFLSCFVPAGTLRLSSSFFCYS